MLQSKSYSLPASKTFLLLFLGCLLQTAFLKSVAQNNGALVQSNLQVFVLKDSMEMEENVFGFNSCTLLYNGPSGANAEIKIAAPEFVSVISPLTTTYLQLAPNQQQVLSLRFIAYNSAKTRDWQPLSIQIRLKETGELIEKKFWLRMKAFSKWRCGLTQPEILVQTAETKARFGIMLQNLGNTAEEYSLHFQSDLSIENDKKFERIQLGPMESRLLEGYFLLGGMQRHASGNTVTVEIKNSRGEEKVLLQKIRILSNQYSGEHFAWLKAPLSIEASAQKNGYGDVVYTASLQGRVMLSDDKTLLLSTQLTNLKQQFLFNNQFLVQYENRNLRLKAGTITDYRHFIINGTGGDALVRMKKSTLQLTGIKSNLGAAKQIEAKYNYDWSKTVSLSTDGVLHSDEDQKTISRLLVNTLSWQLSSATSFSIQGGLGKENLQASKADTALFGGMMGYQFQTSLKRFRIASQVNFYSKNFPGLNKGFEFHNHELTYAFNRFSLGGFYQTNKKIFTAADDTAFHLLLNVEQKEWGLKTGFQTTNLLLSLSASLHNQQQDSANAAMVRIKKIAASFLWTIRPGFTFSLMSNAGLVNVAQQPDIKPFWSFTNYGSLQSRHLGLNFQVNTGPFYYFEVKEFLQKAQGFQRIQLSPFYEAETRNRIFFDRLQVTYNSERPMTGDNYFILNQALFSPQNLKTDFSLLTNLNLTNARNSFVSVSVRKKLSVPVWKRGASYNFGLLLFKDKNNNNQYDKDIDEVIPQAVLAVNENMVQSNAAGEVLFKNMDASPLRLYFGSVASLQGWIPKDGLKQIVVPAKDAKKIFIPFKESRTVTGSIQFYFDNKSDQRMELGNIRLTATDEGGNNVSTLTDDNGRFFFNLPAGQYIITLNTAAFDEQFKPTEISKTADLKNNTSLNLIFDVRQKKRQINIRKAEN